MERKDLRLLWGWPVYLILFFLSERLIPGDSCAPVRCPLDDRIPFCEWFLIPYISWYPLIAGSLLWFLRRDRTAFRRLQIYILITQVIGLGCFFLLPTRQDLRPAVFPRDNILTRLTGLLYAVDTPTGVCPSMHAAWSLALICTWTKKKDAPLLWREFVTVWCVLICASVVFIKQHSALDILAAIPVGLIAEGAVYFHLQKGK